MNMKNAESLCLRGNVFLKVNVVTSIILLNQLLAERWSGWCGATPHSHSRIQLKRVPLSLIQKFQCP